jgi:hypothetical protein
VQADLQAAQGGDASMDGELASDSANESHFQRTWWGRHQPLEPDPRNMLAAPIGDGAQGSCLRQLSLADLEPREGRECAPCATHAWILCIHHPHGLRVGGCRHRTHACASTVSVARNPASPLLASLEVTGRLQARRLQAAAATARAVSCRSNACAP